MCIETALSVSYLSFLSDHIPSYVSKWWAVYIVRYVHLRAVG
jgi:hypothetical protein